jgi:hypothetical protein
VVKSIGAARLSDHVTKGIEHGKRVVVFERSRKRLAKRTFRFNAKLRLFQLRLRYLDSHEFPRAGK